MTSLKQMMQGQMNGFMQGESWPYARDLSETTHYKNRRLDVTQRSSVPSSTESSLRQKSLNSFEFS